MRKHAIVLTSLVVLVLVCQLVRAGESAWKPSKTVTIRVGASAGGGTDLVCRALAAALKEEMGANFQVVNNPGGGGGIALNAVWQNRHDGYTLVGAHDGMPALAVSGAFNQTADVWDWMIGGGSYAILSVHSDSPYQTLDELLDAAAQTELRIGASTPTSTLGIKYAQFAQLAARKGVKFNYLSYEGSAPTNVAALSKEIDVVITAAGEQLEYVKAGHFRPLASLELNDVVIEGLPPIKSLGDWFPEFKEMKQVFQWWGLALPKDAPEEVRLAYQQAFQKAMQSKTVVDAFQNLAAVIFNDGKGYVGEEAERRIKAMESGSSWILYEAGLVTTSPEKFGIEK